MAENGPTSTRLGQMSPESDAATLGLREGFAARASQALGDKRHAPSAGC